MQRRPPNLLFLIADDHAGYVLGAHGNRRAATPNLDRLARQGVRFAANFCNSPVCTASRQSILTGLYPHAAGVTHLRTPLAEEKVTLADLLKASGYQTAAFGKMHFNQPGRDGLHGFDTAYTEERVNREWREAIGRPLPPWRPFQDPAAEWLNAGKRALPFRDEEMRSFFQLNRAKSWLSQHNGQAPWAMWFSLQEPHSPFHFPSEDQARFAPQDFAVPRVGPEDAGQIPLIFRSLTPEQKQGIIAAYYTSAQFLDRNMGRMLDHLQAIGAADNTLVVYVADHGYCLGQHGRFEKHCFYEPAIHVPLILRFPGQLPAGKVFHRRTESVDVSPTLARLLNLKARFPKTHGRDLLTDTPRDEIFSVYQENEEACLIWERWKLIVTTGARKRTDGYETDNPTPGPQTRLYDRRRDPGEFFNVAKQYPALVETLRRRMTEKFAATHPREGLTLEEYLKPVEPAQLSPA